MQVEAARNGRSRLGIVAGSGAGWMWRWYDDICRRNTRRNIHADGNGQHGFGIFCLEPQYEAYAQRELAKFLATFGRS